MASVRDFMKADNPVSFIVGKLQNKKLPSRLHEAGRGENQTQQLKLYFVFYSIDSPL